MSWPLISDFSRMLRNPAAAFRDPVLKQSQIECDNLGQPKPRSGNFATVYRAFCPEGRELAIRVFNRRADERRERYAACSRFFQTHALHSIVPFRYEQQGIRSAGDKKMYPLVIMDWVDGLTLFEWVRARCRENYAEALRIGADVWLQLVSELRGKGVAHGDLQHGNVMVTRDGHFRLVDYDCLAVPELMGRVNIEVGLPPYQHPKRDASTLLSPDLDNFSALFIYTALRALAAQPQLWQVHIEATEYDKLLFRAEDFQNPAQSQLYYDLMNSPDPIVRGLTQYLVQLANGPTAQTEPLDDVLLLSSPLQDLIQAADWDRVVRRVEMLRPGEQIPPQFHAYIAAARQRADLRVAMQQAYDAGNEAELAQLYQPELLQGYPAAENIARLASQAEHVSRLVEVLRSSMQLKCWDAFQQTWAENESLLASRPSGKALQEEYQRTQAVAELHRLLSDTNSDDHRVIDLWRQIRSLGGDASKLRPHVEQRVARQRFWKDWTAALETTPGESPQARDRKLQSTWNEAHFKGWTVAEAARKQHDEATQRIKWFAALLQLAQQHDDDSDAQLIAIAKRLGPDYDPAIPPAVKAAKRRVGTQEAFEKRVLFAETEQEVLDAWQQLEASGEAPNAGAKIKNRVQLAEKRLPLLRSLRGAESLPPQAFDAQLIKLWDDELFQDCNEADRWRKRRADALQRSKVLAQIDEAIQAEDIALVQRLTHSSCLHGYPLPANVRKSVAEFEAQGKKQVEQQRQALLQSLLANDRKRFLEQFDLGMLRELCESAPHHRQIVEHWTSTVALPAFEQAVTESTTFGVQPLEAGGFHASWEWPEKFGSVQIRIAVMEREPTDKTHWERIDASYATNVYRKGWLADDHGHSLAANPEWEDYHVALWGIFDLGFQSLTSACVPLGALKPPKRKRGWSFFGGK